MKFKIAICDNDQEDLNRNANIVNRFFKEQEKTMKGGEIYLFNSSKELLQRLKKEAFDLYLLDVLMPEVNGIELGKAIRERNKSVPIFYMTSSREFAFEAYGVHAMFYVEKPIVYEKLKEELFVALKFWEKQKEEKIPISTREGVSIINKNELLYVENEARIPVYHMNGGKNIAGLYNRQTFEKTVENVCSGSNFIHPHKSYYVNMQYIKRIKQNSIFLDNDEELPISRKHLVEIKKRYLNYITEEKEIRE